MRWLRRLTRRGPDPSRIYFHGGVPGLDVGDFIDPPTLTGARSLTTVAGEWEDTDGRALATRVRQLHRNNRVYLTSNMFTARLFAALAPYGSPTRGGDVYEVAPIGRIEADPDWRGTRYVSIACPRGQITRIVERRIQRAQFTGRARGML